MQAEREELIKHTFPQLRKLCEARGVAWSEVDLRWGVTDEQKAEGAVLPICLGEIDRSRPYFIGLLGQRYGWIPEALPAGLGDQLPWLNELTGTSVTEMEILHGVLNDPGAAGHAYFYMRDPAWIMTRTTDEQRVMGEFESDDEIALVGPEVAAQHAALRRQRLVALKRRIDDSGFPTWEYPDPRGLGERVLRDFSALIDTLYPLGEEPDSLARDADAHRAFGISQTIGHVVRAGLSAEMDSFALGDQPPLVISGEPGAGASAGASAWLRSWSQRCPDDVVIEHHVGATADASEWQAMAQRLVGELSTQLGFTTDDEAVAAASDANTSRASLFSTIARAGRMSRRCVILVDNADLLTDSDGAPDLTWLPSVVPPTVRVIVTTSGPRPVEAAKRRGWPVIKVDPLDQDERRSLIRSFLGRYSKGLDEVHVARLVGVATTGNELFLTTVLDELRQHGDHFTLGKVIDYYLASESLDGLLGLVLERYERDFERDRPGLVRDAMRSLWAARRGLSDPELRDILGVSESGHEPLPHAVWSPLLLAAEAGLVTRSGQLCFATEAHRQAVERRYVSTPQDRRDAHSAVATTFRRYELSPRVVDELPWQQHDAGDIAGMVATISDLDFVGLAYRQSHAELRQLWALAERAGHSVVDAYRTVVDTPASAPEVVWEVARLVTDAGYPGQSLALHRYIVDSFRAGNDPMSVRRLPAALVNLGSVLIGQGELVAAEPPLQEAINLARARDDLAVLTAALGNLALSRRDRGDIDAALAMFAEEEAICRRIGDAAGLQAGLGNRASMLRDRGDLVAALGLMKEQEDLCRSIGDSAGVARALVAQGALQADSGNPIEAIATFRAYRELSSERGDLRDVVEAGINELTTLRQVARLDESEHLAVEIEALARRLGDEPLIARVLDGRSRIASDRGNWASADRLAQEALLTARSAGVPAISILALGVIGTARRELGDLKSARAAHLEEERLAIANHLPASVATAQVNLASVDIAENDLSSALARYSTAEPALRQLNMHMVLVPLLANRSQVHAALGNHPAAIDDLIAGGRSAAAIGALAQSQQMLTKGIEMMYAMGRQNETEPVWANVADVSRGLGDESSLQRALGEQAMMVLGRGDTATAAGLFDEQEQICRRIGDHVGLAACVGNRAILLRNTGDLPAALRCVDEQIEIAKASGNGQGYLFGIANRGEILGALGRIGDALSALNEARQMASNNGLTPMVQQLDQMIMALAPQQQ